MALGLDMNKVRNGCIKHTDFLFGVWDSVPGFWGYSLGHTARSPNLSRWRAWRASGTTLQCETICGEGAPWTCHQKNLSKMILLGDKLDETRPTNGLWIECIYIGGCPWPVLDNLFGASEGCQNTVVISYQREAHSVGCFFKAGDEVISLPMELQRLLPYGPVRNLSFVRSGPHSSGCCWSHDWLSFHKES